LFEAAVLVAYLVQPGDTLSGIAASHGVSVASVEAANPQLSDPSLIYVGERIEIPRGSSASPAPYVLRRYTPPESGSSGYLSSSLSDIPGVPQSFAACVAFRESTDLQNPAADGNAYGIMPSSGYDVYGTSLANQKHVFAELYRQYGSAPWVSDGCVGLAG
jgi:murein DD-endopeptidase MepM/ murein hydrolase activator NlpD